MDAECIPQATGRVVWITGLSGAGKTTLAKAITARLQARDEAVVLLDGDGLRELFGSGKGYHRAARLDLAQRYAQLCLLLASQDLTVVIATISLFREVHAWNRAHLPGYFEVFLKVPLEVLRRRDPHGLYRRFDAGEVSQVAGLDLAVDEPAPDLLLEYCPGQDPERLAEVLLQHLLETKMP